MFLFFCPIFFLYVSKNAQWNTKVSKEAKYRTIMFVQTPSNDRPVRFGFTCAKHISVDSV